MRIRHLFMAVMMASVTLGASARNGKVLKIDFSSPIKEQAAQSPFDLLSMIQGSNAPVSMLSYVRAIDAAAGDKSISMIYMTPDKIDGGLAHAEEIRQALSRFRASGKKIVAYCHDLGNMSYYLASVADLVILDPSADPFITGLASQQFFLKDILDTLGIDVQLIRHGKYKSAGEMFVRNSSSDENRMQNQVMINSLWNGMVDDISSSRGFTSSDFNGWLDNLELKGSKSFKSHGLVDELWFKNQLDSCICSQLSVPTIELVRFVKINRYAEKLKKGSRKNRIAVVYADGEIVMDGDDSENIVGTSLARTLAKVSGKPKVRAVVLRVNSPGGSAQAAEIIRQQIELLRVEKPVYVSFGDYAASGGYWISAGGGRIFTDNATLTGSIGVFSIVPSFGKALQKNLKVNMEIVGSNAHSDMIAGLRPLSDSELEFFQAQVENVYDKFTDIVSAGRGMEKSKVDELGQGRVWAGSDAVEIGLADCRGGLTDAIGYAAEQLGLGDGDYRIEEYPEVKELTLLELLGQEQPDPEETLTTKAVYRSALESLFPDAGFIRSLTSPVIMTRMETVSVIK